MWTRRVKFYTGLSRSVLERTGFEETFLFTLNLRSTKTDGAGRRSNLSEDLFMFTFVYHQCFIQTQCSANRLPHYIFRGSAGSSGINTELF
jgi:hypothetical protein